MTDRPIFNRAVLLSLRPEWWDRIRSGEKTVEVRRSRPGKIDTPFPVLVYISRNGGIQGEFLCTAIHRMKVDPGGELNLPDSFSRAELERIRAGTCLSEETLAAYSDGRKLWGWEIRHVTAFFNPVPLRISGLARPPESWQYLDYPAYLAVREKGVDG